MILIASSKKRNINTSCDFKKNSYSSILNKKTVIPKLVQKIIETFIEKDFIARRSKPFKVLNKLKRKKKEKKMF